MADSGAAGDGVTDDTFAVNAFLKKLKLGARVWIPENTSYLISSADLVIPPDVILQGGSSPQSPEGAISLQAASGFTLAPSHTIRLGHGSQLVDLAIRRAGMVPNPTAEQTVAAVATWGRERSVGITIPYDTGGTALIDVFVEGFNTCIQAFSGQFSIQRVDGDCYNGIDVSHAGDNHYIDDVRFEPYYSLHTKPETGAWARPGIAFNFHDGNTGTFLTRSFSFMYASGVVLNDVGVTQIANSGFEWQASAGNNITGTKGIRWINHNAATSTSDVYAFGFDIPISDEGAGEVVMTATNAPASHTDTTFLLAGAPGTATELTFVGASKANSLCSISISAMRDSKSSATLTTAATDCKTPAEAAFEISRLVNANQKMIAAGVFSHSTGGKVTIYPPAGTQLNINLDLPRGISYSQGVGARVAGSYGAIIDATTVGSDGKHPIYTFGPGVFSWQIHAPITGDNILPENWVNIAPDSIGRVQLLDIRWSAHPEVIHCGDGATISRSATDASGAITEGLATGGCQLMFRRAWPWPPDCTVTSPTGSNITRYTTSSRFLTIEHPIASGDRFVYRCDL